jgi:hypothetical protein
MPAKLTLGQMVITPGASDAIHPEDVLKALERHASNDWGDVCPEDKALNYQALVDGCRVLSAYTDRNQVKFWIITEADRSVTTVLLPEEY